MKGKNLPSFSERFVAFMIDGLLFTAGFFGSLKLINPEYLIFTNPNGRPMYLVWLILWIVYNAVCSSNGRVTLGKKIVGLRVVAEGGKPLGLGRAFLRAVGYVPSSILSIGFLWAFFHPRRKTW